MNSFCDMDGPFICDADVTKQTAVEGRKYFVWGTDSNGDIANIPIESSAFINTAVPGEGIHTWDDSTGAVADWVDPLLIVGLYDGKYYSKYVLTYICSLVRISISRINSHNYSLFVP